MSSLFYWLRKYNQDLYFGDELWDPYGLFNHTNVIPFPKHLVKPVQNISVKKCRVIRIK